MTDLAPDLIATALGLCLEEIARLTAERDEWRDADRAECAENARLRARLAECERTIAALSGFDTSRSQR